MACLWPRRHKDTKQSHEPIRRKRLGTACYTESSPSSTSPNQGVSTQLSTQQSFGRLFLN